MSNNLKTVFRGATRIQDTIQFVQDKVQEGYIVEQVTEVPLGIQIAMKQVGVEATPADVSELLETKVEDIVEEPAPEAPTEEEVVEATSEPEVESEDPVEVEESIDEVVVDWEHVATLATSAELEDYFEPLGFNANPNHKPATIIKKARVHFGV